ncbi:MAG: pitrilysin family protein [Mariprofundaceae bacterium]|nr:pitrilysin family protein [Mariprofundaceae bacterium]
MRILLLLLLFSTPLHAAELQQTTFSNGVKLVVEEDYSAPVAMVQVWLKVGGRDEVPGKTGLAHVFEHMMFKGSKALKPGEYSKRIAAMGGNDNAFTSHDFTAYFETVPAAQVDTVLKMEAERFAHLSLDAEEFGREIKVIMEERRMRTDDDPNSHMFEELSAVALRLHPYRNPVIGWMQDLKKLTIDDVRSFYKKHYVARNVTVVIVGDVDFKHVKKVVARSFGSMKDVAVPPRFNPTEPEPLGSKRVEVHLPAKSPVLAITLPVPVWLPGKNDTEVAALAVATHILAGGRTAILQRQLVDTQRKAFSTSAGYDPFGMGLDLWYAYGMLGAKQSTKAFEKALWVILKNMGAKPVSEKQLQTAKKNMIASEIFAQDSLYLRAKEIGRMETVGIGAVHKDEWLAAIRAVTAKDVQKVAAKYFRPERATTGILKPEVQP